MTDDIVTRLREHASQIRCVVGVNTSVVIPILELEAADEIERLRKVADDLYRACMRYSDVDFVEAVNNYRKMVE